MRSPLTIIIVVIIGIALWWFFFRGGSGANSMSPADFVAAHDANGLIVDVRTAGEFEGGHLDGALNVNVFDDDFRSRVEGYDRTTPVYLYCGSGQRSGRAAAILTEMGFEQAYNVGGYGALKSAGAPVVEP